MTGTDRSVDDPALLLVVNCDGRGGGGIGSERDPVGLWTRVGPEVPTLSDPLRVVPQVLGPGRVQPEHGAKDVAEADLALHQLMRIGGEVVGRVVGEVVLVGVWVWVDKDLVK